MLMLPMKADHILSEALQFRWNNKTHPNEGIVEVAKSQLL